MKQLVKIAIIRCLATFEHMQVDISPQLYLHDRIMVVTGCSLLVVRTGYRRPGLHDFSTL